MANIEKCTCADLQTIEDLTPFAAAELAGERLARGNMLGGANVLQAQ